MREEIEVMIPEEKLMKRIDELLHRSMRTTRARY